MKGRLEAGIEFRERWETEMARGVCKVFNWVVETLGLPL